MNKQINLMLKIKFALKFQSSLHCHWREKKMATYSLDWAMRQPNLPPFNCMIINFTLNIMNTTKFFFRFWNTIKRIIKLLTERGWETEKKKHDEPTNEKQNQKRNHKNVHMIVFKKNVQFIRISRVNYTQNAVKNCAFNTDPILWRALNDERCAY